MIFTRVACLAMCAASACTTAPDHSKPSPAPPEPVTKPAEPAGAPHAAPGHDDVIGEAGTIRVGQPRMQLAENSPGTLVVRAKAGLVFANQGPRMEVWDLHTGKLQHDVALTDDAAALAGNGLVSIAVAYDASRFAVGLISKVRLFHDDKTELDVTCSNARGFSHDGKLFACDRMQPEIWDLTKRTKAFSAPAGAPKGSVTAAHFSSDDKSLFWATDHDLVRWDFATTGSVAAIYHTNDVLGTVAFSESGRAFVTQRPATAYTGGHAVLVELASGKTTPLPDTYLGTISPSGKLVAIIKPTELDVLEVAGGKVLWKGTVTPPVMRVAFGEDDGVIAFGEGHAVRVVELPAGAPRTFEAPSRFVGWLGDGAAAIEHTGSLARLTLADTSWGAADRAALVPARPKDAPAWAQWLAEAPTGVMAAEPSKRHDADPAHRDATECDGKLRVWTASGGVKTLPLACTKGEDATPDPGWEIGGGWALALTTKLATIYDAKTGKRKAALPVEKPTNPKFPPEFWASALSPDGSLLALVWRHPAVGSGGPGDPHEDVMHQADQHDRADCDHDAMGHCVQQYVVEVWSLSAGDPKRVWQEPLAEAPSGAIAFDHAAKRVIVGFGDGNIRAWDTSPAHPEHAVALHHFAITRLSVAPGDGWVFSEDRAGEQRLWRAP